MKRYYIKVFDKSWIYKTTINPNAVMNDVSFSENVNWWQWELMLNLALDFWDKTFNWWELIKVILYSDKYKQWKQIYFWYVSQISRIYDINKWYIQIRCLWIASLLTQILYSWTPSWTSTTILNWIISHFNDNYSWLIMNWQIDSYSENLSFDFEEWTTCSEAINTVADSCNYYRFVDSEWKFNFRKKFSQSNHIIANNQALESMELNYNIESLVNKLYVSRNDWTVQTYEDTDSQDTYWIKEKFLYETSLEDQTTQDEFWNNYLEQYSNPKNASTIIVNSEYDIESVIPWDTITVVNTSYKVKDLLIEKINYTPSRITMTLEENETLRNVISE